MTVGEWIVDVEPNCTTIGSKHAICYICGETASSDIAAKHNLGTNGICIFCGEELQYIVTNDVIYPFIEIDGVLQSTNQEHRSSSSYVITANTALIISFEYNVSSERTHDKFYILHNSTQKVSLSGTSNSYTRYTITLVAGETLTFQYTKDGITSSGEDCCYIKDLTITIVN